MTIRLQAQRLLAVVQTALRSGEWIPSEDSMVRYAVPALSGMLVAATSSDVVQYYFDDLAELVGQAILSGEWTPGDWASEWRDHVTVDPRDGRIAAPPVLPRLAA
jgi:hypothetical protein